MHIRQFMRNYLWKIIGLIGAKGDSRRIRVRLEVFDANEIDAV